MKKTNKIWLTVAASALVLSLSIGSALAYFSATTSAAGDKAINLGSKTELKEELEAGVKTIGVTNTGDTSVYVRVAVIYGGSMRASVELGERWFDGGDGYYYYASALAPKTDDASGESTTDIVVTPEVESLDYDTDILVIEECTQYIFDEGNGPDYTGWSLTADTDVSSSYAK